MDNISKFIVLNIVFISLFSIKIDAIGASFDCNKATITIETTICANSELSKLDDYLNKTYLEAQKYSTGKEKLESEQLLWLKKRNKCDDVLCLKKQYLERIYTLNQTIPIQNKIALKNLSPKDYRVIDSYRDAEDLLKVRTYFLKNTFQKYELGILIDKAEQEWRQYRDELCKFMNTLKFLSKNSYREDLYRDELQCKTNITIKRNNNLQRIQSSMQSSEELKLKSYAEKKHFKERILYKQKRLIVSNRELKETTKIISRRLKKEFEDNVQEAIWDNLEHKWREYKNKQCLLEHKIKLSFDMPSSLQDQDSDVECEYNLTLAYSHTLKSIRNLLRTIMTNENASKIILNKGLKKINYEWKTKYLCKLENPPDNAQIFVIGRYAGITDTNIQLGSSGNATKEVEVVVNNRKTPVILVLMAYDPVLWKVSKTNGVNIAAIIVGGYHTQAVVGVSPEVLVKYFVYEDKGMCKYFYAYKAGKELNQAIQRINDITGSDNIKILTNPRMGRYYIGPIPTKNDYLITVKDLVPRKIGSPSGQKGLDLLVKQGKIRPASLKDIKLWEERVRERYRRYGGNLKVEHYMDPSTTYVVLSDFDLPTGLTGAHARFFIIPEDKAPPGGPKGHNTFYLMKHGSCIGPTPGCNNL